MVDPPDEILKKGMEKFKCCLVGKFTKGILSFKKLKEIAFNIWGNKGLSLVSQKNDSTFMFKFNSICEKNVILSKGTWYFERRPMVVTNWGSNIGAEHVSSIALWVKFSDVPDCYWTKKGFE